MNILSGLGPLVASPASELPKYSSLLTGSIRLLVLTLLTISLMPLTAAAQTGTIAGQVTDECTGAPVPGVNVLIVETSQGSVTNVDGFYQILNVTPGTYTVRVSSLGYDTEQAQVDVVADGTTTQNFQLGDCLTVTHTDDAGANSLRDVIAIANGTEGTNTIIFDIPGEGPHTILLSSPLPAITDPLIIDGISQTGASCGQDIPSRSLQIVLSAGEELDASGLILAAGSDGSVIRGLVVNGFPQSGILISGSSSNTIECNLVGTNAAGTAEGPGNGYGINIGNGSKNVVGGTGSGAGNLVSGNTADGVHFEPGGNENLVQGNFIGTDISGTEDLGNSSAGVGSNQGAGNTIGGLSASARNVISGNGLYGIEFAGAPATGNVVVGNYIGLDASGENALGNSTGVIIQGGANGNYIGSTSNGGRNLIAGNAGPGVHITNLSSSNVIDGNWIGVDPTGTGSIPNAGAGVQVEGSENTIGGTDELLNNLISGNGTDGILILGTDAHDNVVVGNRIGTTADGTIGLGNSDAGVRINNAPNNRVGGPTADEGNVLSANDLGIVISGSGATGNSVQGNYIGTDWTAFNPVPNQTGIFISGASANVIGGTTPGERNIIAANTNFGIIFIDDAFGNTVHGNYIGTIDDGMAPLPNRIGVHVLGAHDNIIGGPGEGQGNLISGNEEEGILILEGASFGNIIQGNEIGTNADGSAALGNGGNGIRLDSQAESPTYPTDTQIGGTSPGAGNTIAYNGGVGVAVVGGTENTITSNSILENGGLGIDLGHLTEEDNVTLNDDGDADTGANNLQNTPVIQSVSIGSSTVTVDGSLNSTPSTTFTLEFFANVGCDASGYGEGQQPLGSTSVVTDSDGDVSFSEIFSVSEIPGNDVTVTATDPDGNTSEFSACGGPEIAVDDGYVYDYLATGLAGPQGMTLDPSGNLVVAASDGGQVLSIDPTTGAVSVLVSNMGSPIDVGFDAGGALYVSDLDLNAVYKFSPSMLSGAPIDFALFDPQPHLQNLDGPTHIEVEPNGDLVMSLVRGTTVDRVVQVYESDEFLFVEDLVTFTGNTNPQGLAYDGDELYMAYQIPGEVRRLPAAEPTPVDGTTLTTELTGLDNPNSIDFTVRGDLLVATASQVAIRVKGTSAWVPFVTGLSGDPHNGVLATSEGAIYVADKAAGRIVRVAAPKQQVLPSSAFSFRINAGGSPRITDGSDTTAVKDACQTWAAVATSDFTCAYDGEVPLKNASGTDGVNLVTFEDDQFLFDNNVLAVAAKTIVFDSEDVAHIEDVDIVFNPYFVQQSVPSLGLGTTSVAGAFDIQSIATHEFGHAVGLVHSGDPESTMFFVLQPETDAQDLTTDDRAWISYKYPNATFSTLGSIEGIIEDGYNLGSPVAGALVLAERVVSGEGTGEYVHGYSDADGSYIIPGLADGDYRVFAQPLDGNVAGYNFRPINVSFYLHNVTTITDYPNEYYNGLNESELPSVDDPAVFEIVTVASTATADFKTNQDLTPPTVTGISPADGATGVGVTQDVLVSFSEPVVLETLAGAFGLFAEGASSTVGGQISFIDEGQTALFAPNSPLTHDVLYTVSITTSVQDLRGNTLATPFTTTFRTELPDSVAPTVTDVSPADSSGDVFPTSSVTIVFSEQMDAETITGNPSAITILDEGATPVPGSVALSLNNTVATFTPTASLSEDATYDVSVSSSVEDLSGNGLVPFQSTFSTVTAAAPDTAYIGPADGATNVTVSSPVLVDFTEPIDTNTVDQTTFAVTQGGTLVPGTFEFLNLNSRVIFRPTSDLSFNTIYDVHLPSGGIFDVSTTKMPFGGASWSFTTAAQITTPSISSVSPPSAPIGSSVTINGTGFDPVAANNAVSFNGTSSPVTSATLTSLTTTVPVTATSGPLTVTAYSQTSDPFEFGVVVPSEIDNAVIAKTSTEGGTRHAAITPDGAFAYVTNSTANSVSVVDLNALTTLEGSIPVGNHPLKIDINPNGTLAYVTNFDSHTVSVIDIDPTSPTYNTVIDIVAVGFNPYGIAVTPSGDRVYVAEFTSEGVSVIDAEPTSGAFNKVIARTSTEGGSKEVALSPDGAFAFVAGTEGVTIIDIEPTSASYNSVIAKTSVEGGTNSVALTPDGAYAIATTNGGDILIIDAIPSSSTAYQVIAKTSTEGGSTEVALSPDGASIYVTNFDSGTVSVYSIGTSSGAPSAVKTKDGTDNDPITGITVTLTLIDTIEVGTNPTGIVIDPKTGTAVVANTGSNTVSIIRLTGATSDELLLAILNRIQDLVESGELSHGHGAALAAPIGTARFHLSRGREKQGQMSIEVFIKKLNNFTDQGHVDPATRDELLALANLAIDRIGSGSSKSIVEGDPMIDELPDEFALNPNYPNPFNPTTTIEYDIPAGLDGPVHVRLEVFNVLGQRVAVLVNEEQSAGRYRAVWNGRTAVGAEAASGVYLFRIEAGNFRNVKKMTLLR